MQCGRLRELLGHQGIRHHEGHKPRISFGLCSPRPICKCISLHGHAVQGCSHSSAHRSKLWLEYHNARFRTQRQKSAVAAASVTAIGCLLRRWGRAVGRREYLGSAIHETNLDQHRHPRRDRRGVYVPAQRQHMERAGPARHQHRTVNLRPTLPS
ncbi:hypothetical protein D3C71_1308400 [compost metagenome]